MLWFKSQSCHHCHTQHTYVEWYHSINALIISLVLSTPLVFVNKINVFILQWGNATAFPNSVHLSTSHFMNIVTHTYVVEWSISIVCMDSERFIYNDIGRGPEGSTMHPPPPPPPPPHTHTHTPHPTPDTHIRTKLCFSEPSECP